MRNSSTPYSLDLFKQSSTHLGPNGTLFGDCGAVFLRNHAVGHYLGQFVQFLKSSGKPKMWVVEHTGGMEGTVKECEKET